MILRIPSSELGVEDGRSTRSVTAHDVIPTATSRATAARRVSFLNCVDPKDGPNMATRSSVPIT